ncbi:MAG: hypothetical protein JKY54_05545, partial [Flavobacteriales bacterium]|nr:hypothetical protein [Flavobacteriales bacterium]
ARAIKILSEFHDLEFSIESVHGTMSLALENIGAYTDAIEHRKLLLYSQLFNYHEHQLKFGVYYNLGSIGRLFMELEEYDSSQVYFERALTISKDKDSHKHAGLMLNNIGLVFVEKFQCDSAILYYHEALWHYDREPEKGEKEAFMIGLIKGNIAECLSNDDPLKEQYFLEDIEVSLNYQSYQHVVFTILDYSKYLLEINRFSEAEKKLMQAERLALEKNCIPVDVQIDLYNSMVQLYVLTGKRDQAITYYNKLKALIEKNYGKKAGDKLLAIHSSYKLSKIEDELTMEIVQGEKKAAQISVLNKENELTKFRYGAFVVIAILLLGISVLIIVKVKSDAKKRAKERDLKNKLLRLELEYNSDRLNRSILGLSRKREFTEELMDRIAMFDNIDSAKRNSLKMFVVNELDIDDSMLESEKEIQEMGEEFISKLKLKHPELSESDLKMIGYIKMKMTNKRIAEIKNIEPKSVKTAKNRLRKKLKIPAGSDFFDHIDL